MKTLLTNEGKMIQHILGKNSDTLQKYDKLKYDIKRNYKKAQRNKILDLLVPLQTSVVKIVSELERDVESWERTYFIENNSSAPTEDDRIKNYEIWNKIKRIKMGKNLIKNYWKINF